MMQKGKVAILLLLGSFGWRYPFWTVSVAYFRQLNSKRKLKITVYILSVETLQKMKQLHSWRFSILIKVYLFSWSLSMRPQSYTFLVLFAKPMAMSTVFCDLVALRHKTASKSVIADQSKDCTARQPPRWNANTADQVGRQCWISLLGRLEKPFVSFLWLMRWEK